LPNIDHKQAIINSFKYQTCPWFGTTRTHTNAHVTVDPNHGVHVLFKILNPPLILFM